MTIQRQAAELQRRFSDSCTKHGFCNSKAWAAGATQKQNLPKSEALGLTQGHWGGLKAYGHPVLDTDTDSSPGKTALGHTSFFYMLVCP